MEESPVNLVNDALDSIPSEHFAARFALDCAFVDRRLDGLCSVLARNHEVGGIGGEGWSIERRDEGDASWPPLAEFLCSVDAEEIPSDNPDCYLDRPTFHRYVLAVTRAYMRKYPKLKDAIGVVETVVLAQSTRITPTPPS
jgi:hypothetical protein